jgi:hypothetical protein
MNPIHILKTPVIIKNLGYNMKTSTSKQNTCNFIKIKGTMKHETVPCNKKDKQE